MELTQLIRTFKREGIENFVTVKKEHLENVLKELETYKKIAEKLAELINNHDIDEDVCRQMGKDFDCTLFNQDEKFCVQCIIDWARNEVEKDE